MNERGNENGTQVDERPEPSEAEVRELREELTGVHGEAWWRKLEELSTTGPFQAFLERWFPSQAARWRPDQGRRDFLRVMGASLGVIGLGACTRQPKETIVPYASRPEALIPGRPRYFATAFEAAGGDAIGVLVESHMNRPTKVEGNEKHPASLGATDAHAQASLLGLYDPDRSHSVLNAGQISTWGEFLTELTSRLDGAVASEGARLAVLVEDTSSPTLHAQLAALTERLPRASVHHWSPLHRDAAREAALATFGRDVEVRHAFDRARVVVSLDADFLASGPGGVRHARDFAAGRPGRESAQEFNRLYAVECSTSVTGAMADHRLALRPSEVEAFARTLAVELGIAASAPALADDARAVARTAARDLAANAGASIVVAGEGQGPEVHALAHRMNEALRNVGTTVERIPPTRPFADGSTGSIRALVEGIRAGRVESLLILGGNPVLDAPADLDFRQALSTVAFRAHLSGTVDETSTLCHWHVPMAHYLESWGDLRAHDGTATIVQPLIAPLHGGRTAIELLAILNGTATPNPYELVREHWRARTGLEGQAFERWWSTALHDGLVPDSAFAAIDLEAPAAGSTGEYVPASGLEVAFRRDAAVLDGRFANNGWLQETPRPLTRITWDNAALLSPATAEARGLSTGDVVRLTVGEQTVEAPVLVDPGHADEALTVHLGYGRTAPGLGLGRGVGFDAYRLRRSYAPWRAADARLESTGRRHELACVQDHPSMEGRDLVRVATFDRFAADPLHATQPEHGVHDIEGLTFYPEHKSEGYAWGMVIDLNACIGCNACMVACQSENNVPIVGREEVARGRELHWIRIDRYVEDSGAIRHQPVPCMHCENAPCEVVCPVGATVHGDEGLNEMVYNRCVGTRYCANNCPYKVRRFNYFGYADYETESLKLANNPDVTVRTRGVMEKCTYCVQRINQGRIAAKKEGRSIQDGEVVSACMQVCPTQAIVFGDINDGGSRVSAARSEPHHYGLLEEIGTRPRTTYLAKLTNPNPELERGA